MLSKVFLRSLKCHCRNYYDGEIEHNGSGRWRPLHVPEGPISAGLTCFCPPEPQHPPTWSNMLWGSSSQPWLSSENHPGSFYALLRALQSFSLCEVYL